jgi:hypothetical protein
MAIIRPEQLDLASHVSRAIKSREEIPKWRQTPERLPNRGFSIAFPLAVQPSGHLLIDTLPKNQA